MPGFNIPLQGFENCPPTGFGKQSRFQGQSHSIETARSHRYELEFLEPFGTMATGLLLFLSKCTRPAPEIDSIIIHNGQDEIRRPGKHRWKPVEFTFYERVDNDEPPFKNLTASMIFEWWATQMIVVSESRHQDVGVYLRNATLNMLDGIGNAIWTYYIYDAWPSSISPSDLAYSDTNISEITVTLSYNKAIERTNIMNDDTETVD